MTPLADIQCLPSLPAISTQTQHRVEESKTYASALPQAKTNIATTNAGPILTLAQATTLSSTLKVEGGEATIQAASGADANLYLVADNSEDGGDVWRVQATDA